MSFTNGFQKTSSLNKEAGPAKLIGQLGGLATRGGRAAAKGVSEFATAQRASRLSGYRGALTGKANAGVGQLAADKAIQNVQKNNPGIGFNALSDKATQISKDKGREALSRLDNMKKIKATNSAPFYKKHPYITAGGAFLAAKSLTSGEPQQPSQPPQVIQY